MERLVEVCSLEMFLLKSVSVNDKVLIIADTQRWSERKVDPMLCKGDLAFFCNFPVTLESLRLWAHQRILGTPRNVGDLKTVEFADVLCAIAEDQHLTRCAQVRFTGTEEDQAEQHDHGTIDEVLGDQDMEEGGDVLEEADREADLLEQMPLLVTQSPRKNVWHLGSVFFAELALRSGDHIETCDTNQEKHSCRCYVLPDLHNIFQCRQDLSMPGMRQHKA